MVDSTAARTVPREINFWDLYATQRGGGGEVPNDEPVSIKKYRWAFALRNWHLAMGDEKGTQVYIVYIVYIYIYTSSITIHLYG